VLASANLELKKWMGMDMAQIASRIAKQATAAILLHATGRDPAIAE
jgi:hypothetical protein